MFFSQIWSNPFDNSIEIELSKWFENMPRVLKEIFISYSSFLDHGVFFIVVGILLVLFAKTRKIGLVLLLGSLFTLLINDLILKHIFFRTRPYDDPNLVDQLISVVNNNYKVYGIVPSSNSFPSGHSFNAFFAFGGVLSLYLFTKEEKKFYLPYVIFFAVFAFLMGFTRILLSHHYFTDVLAGGSIGFCFGLLSYLIIKYLYILFSIIKKSLLKGEKDGKHN